MNAILGSIAGGQKDVSNQYATNSSSSSVNLQDFLNLSRGQSGLESAAYDNQLSSFKDLASLFNAGPGQNEVQANNTFQNDFAKQLQTLLTQTVNPSAADISGNYQKAKDLFAPQQVALDQQFKDATTSSNRMAAKLGRPGNDPVLRNKLMQEQTRQQSSLNANIGSYAQQKPMIDANNVMQIGGTLSNLRQGLATQALQNRQTMLTMGNQLMTAERNYRLGSAGKSSYSDQESEQRSGGGTKGTITGFTAGNAADIGQMTSIAGAFMGKG